MILDKKLLWMECNLKRICFFFIEEYEINYDIKLVEMLLVVN